MPFRHKSYTPITHFFLVILGLIKILMYESVMYFQYKEHKQIIYCVIFVWLVTL